MKRCSSVFVLLTACAVLGVTLSIASVRAEDGAEPSPEAPTSSPMPQSTESSDAPLNRSTMQQCTITFDTGVVAPINPIVVPCGAQYLNSFPVPTPREDYEFMGWTGIPDEFTATHLVLYDFEVKATYRIQRYLMQYHNEDGSIASTDTVYAGNQAKAPADPVKKNYAFQGWYTDSALTSLFDFSQKLTGSSRTIDLYPKFTLKQYTIKYSSAFSSGSYAFTYKVLDPVTINAGESVTLAKDTIEFGPCRLEGGIYWFTEPDSTSSGPRYHYLTMMADGWSTESNQYLQNEPSAVSYAEGQTITPESDLTLYPHVYIICDAPAEFTLPDYGYFTKQKYEMSGWYTEREGGIFLGNPGDEVDLVNHPELQRNQYFAHGTLKPDPNAGKSTDNGLRSLTLKDQNGTVIPLKKNGYKHIDAYVSADCTTVTVDMESTSDKATVSYDDFYTPLAGSEPNCFAINSKYNLIIATIMSEHGESNSYQIRVIKSSTGAKVNSVMLASGGVSYTGIYSSALNAMTVTVGSGVKAGDLWVGTDQGVNAVTLSSDDGKQQEISISGTVGRTQEDLTLATGANEYKLTASDGSTAMSGSETGVGIRKQIAFARVMPSQAEIGGLMGHQIENEESTGSSASMNLIINRIPEEMPFNSIKVNGAEAVFDRNFGMYVANVGGSTDKAEVAAEFSAVRSVSINGTEAANGQQIEVNSLKQGDNMVWIRTSEADGSSAKYLLDIMKFPQIKSLEVDGGTVSMGADGSLKAAAGAGDNDVVITAQLDDQLESGVEILVDGKPYSSLGTVWNDSFLLEFKGLAAGTHHVSLYASTTDLLLKEFDLIIPDASSAGKESAAENEASWCITYLDSRGNTVSVQWVKTGASPVKPAGYDYPDIANVSAHQDVRPLSARTDSRTIVPNTADRGK